IRIKLNGPKARQEPRPPGESRSSLRQRLLTSSGLPMNHRILFLASALLAALAARSRAAEPEVVRIPIECEDMQGVKWGPEGLTPAWTAGRWGRDLYQNMIFGGVWASRMAAAVTDGGAEKAEVFQDITVPRAG